MSKVDYQKYKKEEHCDYPFQPSSLGYCWGYAEGVDDGLTDDEIEKDLCRGCEFYRLMK